jgi:hypothetical protein
MARKGRVTVTDLADEEVVEAYEMPREAVVNSEWADGRAYVEVGVEWAEDNVTVYAEDGNGGAELLLSIDELGDLIEKLQEARQVAALNA